MSLLCNTYRTRCVERNNYAHTCMDMTSGIHGMYNKFISRTVVRKSDTNELLMLNCDLCVRVQCVNVLSMRIPRKYEDKLSFQISYYTRLKKV